MSIPLFYPAVQFVTLLPLKRPTTLVELCAHAGVSCRGSGAWVDREIEVRIGAQFLKILATPGYRGRVVVEVKEVDPVQASRVALGALAYALFDQVARESIRGATWAKPAKPRGRPASGRALSGAQRQRAHRKRQSLGS